MADNMHDDNRQPSFTELLVQHSRLLQDHLEICQLLQSEHQVESPGLQLLRTCGTDTQKMIDNFEKLRTSFEDVQQQQLGKGRTASNQTTSKRKALKDQSNSGDSQPSKKRLRADQSQAQAHSNVNVQSSDDPSEFFTIDTNPTPLDKLMSEGLSIDSDTMQRKKRQRPDSSIQSVDPTTTSHDNENGARKRSKAHSSPKEDKEEVEPEQNNDTEYENSFLAKVASKHAERAARRAIKKEKKRKRQSNGSLEDHASGDVLATKKKKRAIEVKREG